ncbi:ankyrin repeat domain-containing protein [Mucilaginibacter sp. HMF5004]|uniref:ankyrin repeat domain-containing protein n=1 Tax=Mucilaginibacter rivuli TaxID=2857527 RepID=UPI001C5E33CD|nr:ankyrin repeat domain-containing protein [Mucilaginibacter rivuli]MBW4890713.1 ankyrin repeat domain-containing protein [Mucilaginibacter rivuli]
MSLDSLEQFIQEGDLQGLKQLLDKNPELAKSITSYRVSAVMLACYYKKPAVTEVLLKYIDELSLFEAAAIGKFDVVAHLVYMHPDLVNEFSDDGFTPLGLACYFSQPEIARFLVLKGADVNLASRNGFHVAPIHSAVAANQTEITRMLIEHGAMVNVKQQSGVTPLHSAAQNGNLEILILLLENGAQVNVRMEGGKLPADLAEEKGFMEIAAILTD